MKYPLIGNWLKKYGKNKINSMIKRTKKNLNLKQAEEYLVSTKAFLESKNYKVVYSQENWSKPLLMNKNKPCIRFVDENKKASTTT